MTSSRERFLQAAQGCRTETRPVWLMRQAGRYLPEYRALRAKHGFLEMVKTPALAAEVTLQPLRRFPLDAAILFSDILTVPEALGVPYAFREGGGIKMGRAIGCGADVAALRPEGALEHLEYVYAALRLLRAELGGAHALLGFAGAPWTLAAYLVQGESKDGFPKLLEMARQAPALLEKMLAILADAVAGHLRAQCAAGADAVQIFDSWAGICPREFYERFSLRWVRHIVARLPKEIPVIFFAKGVRPSGALWQTGARVLGVDSETDLPGVAVPEGCAVQGNLDNRLLLEAPEIVSAATVKMLESMQATDGYIVNLGHGILPGSRVESVAALADAVRQFRVAPQGPSAR